MTWANQYFYLSCDSSLSDSYSIITRYSCFSNVLDDEGVAIIRVKRVIFKKGNISRVKIKKDKRKGFLTGLISAKVKRIINY